LDLIVYFLHGAADHPVARNIFIGAENILRFVIAINVGRDEVDGDMFFGTVLNEGIRPRGLRSRRTTDAQFLVHSFYVAGGVIVKFPVRRLAWNASPKIQIGFVP